jgi:hypothetical protein
MQIHMIRQLVAEGYKVIDTGLARDVLLQARYIPERTPSHLEVHYLLNRMSVDYLVSGIVYDYQDAESGSGRPQIGFTVQANRRVNRKTSWSASLRNNGLEGVFFFDKGKVTTAAELAARMTRSAVLSFSQHR